MAPTTRNIGITSASTIIPSKQKVVVGPSQKNTTNRNEIAAHSNRLIPVKNMDNRAKTNQYLRKCADTMKIQSR